MKLQLSPGQSRALAVLLLVLCVSGVYVLVAAPTVAKYQGNGEQIEVLRERLARYSASPVIGRPWRTR